MGSKARKQRLGWVLTCSGHFFTECLEIMNRIGGFDLFLSKAAAEVVRMYGETTGNLPEGTRIFKDTTASAALVGKFYYDEYHTVVLAPTTSNTVAKCVYGISDNLATNVFAQAGKCRVPIIVFSCDTGPELDTMAPKGMVKVYPRGIDLENIERLKSFESTQVVESIIGQLSEFVEVLDVSTPVQLEVVELHVESILTITSGRTEDFNMQNAKVLLEGLQMAMARALD